MIRSAAASEKFATQAIGLVRDFAAFAGRNGVRGAILAIAAAMSEGVGLVLLVPLLSIATAANGGRTAL